MPKDRAPGPYTVRVEVFRWKGILQATFRMLSPTISGLFTHYTADGSVYCDVVNCPTVLHSKQRRVWKGYAACEVWMPGADKWFPTVLEITESCELDMRGVYQRGQVWEVRKTPKVKRKNFPATAKLVDSLDPDQLPPPFDYTPILLTMFYVQAIDLTHKNPMPPRVHMAVCEDEPPINVQPKKLAESPASDERWVPMMERDRVYRMQQANGKK